MVSSETPRGKRLEPDARREGILDVAISLFGERPYSAVTTGDIAEAAGVTRGLIHHYFGTKRGIYLAVVKAMVLAPNIDEAIQPGATRDERIERSVDWFLDSVALHANTYVAVTGTEGIASDPEVEQILADADDIAARKILKAFSLPVGDGPTAPQRGAARAYCQFAKATVREWLRSGALTRDQARMLLIHALVALVDEVFPSLASSPSA